MYLGRDHIFLFKAEPQYTCIHSLHYLGEKRPLLWSASVPKGPVEYMVSRRKSWTTGEDTVRLCEGLPDPCLRCDRDATVMRQPRGEGWGVARIQKRLIKKISQLPGIKNVRAELSYYFITWSLVKNQSEEKSKQDMSGVGKSPTKNQPLPSNEVGEELGPRPVALGVANEANRQRKRKLSSRQGPLSLCCDIHYSLRTAFFVAIDSRANQGSSGSQLACWSTLRADTRQKNGLGIDKGRRGNPAVTCGRHQKPPRDYSIAYVDGHYSDAYMRTALGRAQPPANTWHRVNARQVGTGLRGDGGGAPGCGTEFDYEATTIPITDRAGKNQKPHLSPGGWKAEDVLLPAAASGHIVCFHLRRSPSPTR